MTRLLLPPFVSKARNTIERAGGHELEKIAGKLIRDEDELVKMWNSLYRGPDRDWDDNYVWMFLRQCHNASQLPAYAYLTPSERTALAKRIAALSSELARALKANDLNFHLVACHGINFNGLYAYEDFSDSNQQAIDDCEDPKVAIDILLKHFANRSIKKLEDVKVRGKKAQDNPKQRARLFCRALSSSLFRVHGALHNTVVATAANALYDTSYRKGDITNLLNR